MSGSWKVTLPCTRDEAEAIDAETLADAVLMTTEEVADDRERWRLDAYVEREPDESLLAALRTLAPSAGDAEPRIERLGDEDWVTLSQAGLEPIVTQRFAVHTSAHAVEAPKGGRAFLIEAGRAFGTGHHETTNGCLLMLERLAATGRRLGKIIDVGTGTGLLAFAAMDLWIGAEVTATDIDPAAIEVARDNAAANGIRAGSGTDEIALIVADGALSEAITARAPYDLLIANVLAGPLVSMAPELAAIAAPGAAIVLAGLLDTQVDEVVAAYAGCGCSLVEADRRGDWTILRLTAGPVRFVPAAPPDPRGRDGWALDL
ncbi:MAG: ribonucleotide-diphosphate reductase subunit beta [Sphingomonas bacterium]|uniref:50S ribosomal protein L11 methyltransferase n=1 Tax=Sphingomonas bacterium TaxID=1895847 RepID=UPI0026049B1F|nr:50S ribosomal protein L11 methyltransferase [Sphingomonas bacterium]MDB5694506.1 ribonucleotide-diphosphate reductase subunit beta [Sphingomonas bacterium]